MISVLSASLLLAAAPSGGMSDSTKTALIGVLGVIASAVIGWLAARYAAKKSAQASKEQVKVTERQVDVTEWQAIVTALQSETKRLGDRITDLEGKDTAKQEKIDGLNTKVENLEASLRTADKKYSLALVYIRDLIAWTTAMFKSEELPPPPPPEIANDL